MGFLVADILDRRAGGGNRFFTRGRPVGGRDEVTGPVARSPGVPADRCRAGPPGPRAPSGTGDLRTARQGAALDRMRLTERCRFTERPVQTFQMDGATA
ncbi:hypothetical protein TPA0910_51600 [Streptomyces hygroscopicus subsp. sporocinereus]|uniref:Uncharacterized protein n=1 Tax=Streptomyces hygroscopicus TaxID=1912 RepID=A0ABQ3U555_STRHY|nr:hypothetical protein TPA0910_51600 [Streptomyces hygroscopicus]